MTTRSNSTSSDDVAVSEDDSPPDLATLYATGEITLAELNLRASEAGAAATSAQPA